MQQFFQQYDDHGRKTDYLAGAWTSKQFGNKAAARQIFLGLKSEPTLILESTLESGNLSISFGYWALGYVNEHYRTLMSFPWLEILYGFVKERTEKWFQLRQEQGTSEADWVADYGEEFVAKYQANRAMMEREKRWIESGEDIRELNRNYYIAPRDWDELKRFVAVCHCLVAGWVADEYFLVDVSPEQRQEPLLPALLPELLKGFSADIQQQFIERSVKLYQGLYKGLIKEIPDWEPELRLELAASLIKLPHPAAGIEEINGALRVWLAGRGLVWDGTGEMLPLLAQVAKPEDVSYFQQLYEVWRTVGITDEVNMADAYYRRGEDLFKRRDYDGAIADFDRALRLGHSLAAVQRELVVRLQSHLQDAQKREWEKPLAVAVPQQAAEAGRQRLEQQNQRGQLFSFEIVLVNKRGEEIKREEKQARCFKEKLPNNLILERVFVPGGTLLMGSAEGDSNAQPQHQVTVPDFFLGKHPVTQVQWRAVASLPQVGRSLKPDPSNFKGDQLPVEKINWHDAVEFCARLSQFTGQKYGLPSEAQWEYACRAGTTTPFYVGSTITTALANFDGNKPYGSAPKGQYRQQMTDVGIFPPNAFGLYDMHGNVWEWCIDNWHDNYAGAPIDGSAWITGGNSDRSPLRGGSWLNTPDYCRSAFRNNYYRLYDGISRFGFRVMCVSGGI